MRLKARETLMYAGKEILAGFPFDATDEAGRDLINQDLAVPFNLEDPSSRPDEEDLPDEEDEEVPAPKSPQPAGGETVFSEPEPQKPWTSKKPQPRR